MRLVAKKYIDKLEKMAIQENDQEKLALASKLRIIRDYADHVQKIAATKGFKWSNSYAGKCYYSGVDVPEGKGFYGKLKGQWRVFDFYAVANHLGIEKPDNFPNDAEIPENLPSVGYFK